ncbi:MAG: hypothetical protein JEZ08_25470 [Clostridiales bacterium]|nr:hypothetical protein [Clostridiales bacterium]
MNINIRWQTIGPMLEIMKSEYYEDIEGDLRQLLCHQDYEVEILRYNKKGLEFGFSKEDVHEFMLHCMGVKKTIITKERLIERKTEITAFIEQIRKNSFDFDVKKKHLELIVEEAIKRASFGLERTNKLPDVDVIFSVGLGATGGWFYHNIVHIDVVQFMNPFKEDDILSVLAHEIHHIGMMKFYQELWESGISLKGKFLSTFAGEGLAVKYGNNGSGFITKAIYDTKIDAGLDHDDFNFLKNEFDQMYLEFKNTLMHIKTGEIDSSDKLNEVIRRYWTNLGTGNIPRYHSRIYYFGCEIWGLLHDTYGTEEVFDILRDMENFEVYFNKALKQIEKEELLLNTYLGN